MGRGKPGALNVKAKLTESDVHYIRASSETLGELAQRFNVALDSISAVRTRRTWTHLPEQPQPDCASLNGEEWRPIPIAELAHLYSVSNLGRIKGAATNHQPIKIRKTKTDVFGYTVVVMSNNGKQRRHRVHRLVANAFIGEPPSKHVVNHIDGMKSHNALSNLEYVTPQENTQHAIRIGLIKDPKGATNPKAALSDYDVKLIRWSKMPGVHIAGVYGVHKGTVNRIRRNRSWTHI